MWKQMDGTVFAVIINGKRYDLGMTIDVLTEATMDEFNPSKAHDLCYALRDIGLLGNNPLRGQELDDVRLLSNILFKVWLRQTDSIEEGHNDFVPLEPLYETDKLVLLYATEAPIVCNTDYDVLLNETVHLMNRLGITSTGETSDAKDIDEMAKAFTRQAVATRL